MSEMSTRQSQMHSIVSAIGYGPMGSANSGIAAPIDVKGEWSEEDEDSEEADDAGEDELWEEGEAKSSLSLGAES